MVILVSGMRMRLNSERETKAISGVNTLSGDDNTNVIKDIRETYWRGDQTFIARS